MVDKWLGRKGCERDLLGVPLKADIDPQRTNKPPGRRYVGQIEAAMVEDQILCLIAVSTLLIKPRFRGTLYAHEDFSAVRQRNAFERHQKKCHGLVSY